MDDFQRNKVYKWENVHIGPIMGNKRVSLETAQMLVDYIWNELGRENPPKVNVNTALRRKSYGNRYEISLATNMMNEYTLIHELAHSYNLCEDRKDDFDHHGPNFVGDYCYLLVRFCGFDPNMLAFTLKKANVKVNMVKVFA